MGFRFGSTRQAPPTDEQKAVAKAFSMTFDDLHKAERRVKDREEEIAVLEAHVEELERQLMIANVRIQALYEQLAAVCSINQ